MFILTGDNVFRSLGTIPPPAFDLIHHQIGSERHKFKIKNAFTVNRKEFIQRSAATVAGMAISLNSMGKISTDAERFLLAQNPLRTVGKIYPSKSVKVAPTLDVMRSLPIGRGMVIDPFVMLDHFGPVYIKDPNGIGVPPHPHRGFEPVTFLFDGHVEHKDSLGNTGLLDAGGVQWMTSGKGIVHSEDMAKRYKNGGFLHGIQLWVNLPKDKKMVEPGYQNITKEMIPTVKCENGKARIQVVAGDIFDVKGPTSTFTPIIALMIELDPGTKLEIPVPVHYNSFLQLLEGNIMVEGQKVTGSNLVLYNNDGAKALVESDPSNTKPTKILFMAGEPINEPVVMYGPFVMNSKEEIEAAYADYRAGKMGTIDF